MKGIHHSKSLKTDDEVDQAIRFHIHQIHQTKHAHLENNPPRFDQMCQYNQLLNHRTKVKVKTMTWSWVYAVLLFCVGYYYLMPSSNLPVKTEYASQTYNDFTWETDEFEWLLDTEWQPDET